MERRPWVVLVILITVPVTLGLAGTVLGAWSDGAQPAVRRAQADAVWNSGWVGIEPGQVLTFTHNLGGDPALYAVDLWYRDTRSEGLGVHHRAYGGMDVSGHPHGVHWQNLTDTTVRVMRWREDVVAGRVRMRIWIREPPEYDSGWVDIAPGRIVTLTHDLGGNVDEYAVGMKFWDTSRTLGIHHYAFGGFEADGQFMGAAWQNLTDNTIQVRRFADDFSARQVRVFITRPDPPAYDSGWQPVERGQTYTFTHSLGGNPSAYVVRASARSTAPGGPGINTRAAGGLEIDGHFFGSNWQRLTARDVGVFRGPHDSFAEEVRIRIWRPGSRTHLPLIARNHSTVSEEELAYDDGSAESSQSYTAGNGFAVRFTAPDTSAQLVRARYFFIAPVAPIEVHVWDADRNNLITPFTAAPAGDGWFDVDLSSLNLIVSGDFYVGFLYTVDIDPTLGVDTSAPDSRSYEVPWETVGYDYMIRAVTVPQ